MNDSSSKKTNVKKKLLGCSAANFSENAKKIQDSKKTLDEISVNTKFISIEKITPSPSNPRRLAINAEDINAALAANLITKDVITSDLEKNVVDFFKNSKKSSDYLKTLQLALSIPEPESLLQAVVVWSIDGSNFNLIAGHRRFFAHLIAGHEYISATIKSHQPSELELSILQWTENSSREDLTSQESFLNIKSICTFYKEKRKFNGEDNYEIKIKDIEKLCSLSRSQAHKYWSLLVCENEELIEQFLENKISLSHGDALTRCSDDILKKANELLSKNEVFSVADIKNGFSRFHIAKDEYVSPATDTNVDKNHNQSPQQSRKSSTKINLGNKKTSQNHSLQQQPFEDISVNAIDTIQIEAELNRDSISKLFKIIAHGSGDAQAEKLILKGLPSTEYDLKNMFLDLINIVTKQP